MGSIKGTLTLILRNQGQNKGLRAWNQGLEAQYQEWGKNGNIKQVTSLEQNQRSKNQEQKLKRKEHKSYSMK